MKTHGKTTIRRTRTRDHRPRGPGLFAEKGLHGVSVDEIVNVVRVSPAVLDKYFPCREALQQTALRTRATTREDYIEAVLDKQE